MLSNLYLLVAIINQVQKMKTLKVTFTVPEDLVEEFTARVPKGKRSAFIAEAVRARFIEMEQLQQMRELIKSFGMPGQEDMELDLDLNAELEESIGTVDDVEDLGDLV
jgi:hypothetical protein